MAKDTRRVDGKPETEVDRKFFDLRQSGYDGWFDWRTGEAVDENGKRIDPKTAPKSKKW